MCSVLCQHVSLFSLFSANVYIDAGFTDRNLSSSIPDYLAEQSQPFWFIHVRQDLHSLIISVTFSCAYSLQPELILLGRESGVWRGCAFTEVCISLLPQE